MWKGVLGHLVDLVGYCEPELLSIRQRCKAGKARWFFLLNHAGTAPLNPGVSARGSLSLSPLQLCLQQERPRPGGGLQERLHEECAAAPAGTAPGLPAAGEGGRHR